MAAFWAVFTFGGSGPAITAHVHWILNKKFKLKFKWEGQKRKKGIGGPNTEVFFNGIRTAADVHLPVPSPFLSSPPRCCCYCCRRRPLPLPTPSFLSSS
jgi:hypothetical protein